jgi:hypothetical protein
MAAVSRDPAAAPSQLDRHRHDRFGLSKVLILLIFLQKKVFRASTGLDTGLLNV